MVRHFNSSACWNTIPMSRAGSKELRELPIWMVPPSASWSPARIFSTVVLPQPDGPTSEISSPSLTSMVTSETARNSWPRER